MEIKPCASCGEDGILREQEFGCWVVVRRMSKCKYYQPNSRVWCKTEVYETPEPAVQEWNEKQMAGAEE